MQNPLDRLLFHPLARRLAYRLAGTAITPNMVSIAGALVVVTVGLLYIQPGWPAPVLAGLFLHLAWHVLDGADGDLARLTGRASRNGEIVDGVCDYAGHFILYALLAIAASATHGWIALALGLAAGLSRIAQASFHEAQRRRYLAWTHSVDWLGSSQDADEATGLGRLGQAYLVVANWLAPGVRAIDTASADPERSRIIRARLRDLGPAAMAGSSLLGAPYRTLALGAAMLVGSPLYYFVYEATVLNLVLVEAVWRSRRTLRHLEQGL